MTLACYNGHHDTDAQRYQKVLNSIAGRRLAVERAGLPGGRVMSEQDDKNVVEEKKLPPKPPGGTESSRSCLSRLSKAPPMPRKSI